MVFRKDRKVSEKAKILRVLSGSVVEPPPIWIMRQAGRYLPEYRETRKRAGSFLDLCLTPELAAEVTLQPIRRFDFDAAILFSDILVIPHALGQPVTFEEGIGPVLQPLPANFNQLDLAAAGERLAPVAETVRLVRGTLPDDKALIGFCGAPWTVATYMIGGRGGDEQFAARRMALSEPEKLQRLIDLLVEASARYLVSQARSGADVVKIFDTWAGVLDDEGFERWCVRPIKAIVEQVRREVPAVPIIAFPRGASARLRHFAKETGVDAVAVDWMTPMPVAREMLPEPVALQGNLDPLRLVAGGSALDDGIETILKAMRGRRHIFNLGHGITPDTPIRHVEHMIRKVRAA
jgi:uroporphyrinogen decarboxylase